MNYTYQVQLQLQLQSRTFVQPRWNGMKECTWYDNQRLVVRCCKKTSVSPYLRVGGPIPSSSFSSRTCRFTSLAESIMKAVESWSALSLCVRMTSCCLLPSSTLLRPKYRPEVMWRTRKTCSQPISAPCHFILIISRRQRARAWFIEVPPSYTTMLKCVMWKQCKTISARSS